MPCYSSMRIKTTPALIMIHRHAVIAKKIKSKLMAKQSLTVPAQIKPASLSNRYQKNSTKVTKSKARINVNVTPQAL